MAKFKQRIRYTSRLAKKERDRNLRMTIIFSLLTAGILAALVYFGVPLFIQLAGWWGDVKSAQSEAVSDDLLPPPPPYLHLSASETTNQEDLSVKGFSEPGSSIAIYLNGQLAKEVVVETSGEFLASDLKLKVGENKLYVVATDVSGNQSEPSGEQTIFYDNQPPALTVEKPTEGETFSGNDQRSIDVVGETDPESRVWVENRLVVVSQKGAFSTKYNLEEGEQELEIKAVDKAGNEVVEIRNVKYNP